MQTDIKFEKYCNELLENLMLKVDASDQTEAICYVRTNYYDYFRYTKLIQLKTKRVLVEEEGSFGYKSQFNMQSPLDFACELQCMRQEQPQLRISLPWGDEALGRYMTVFLAVKDDGDWIHYQHPPKNTPYKNTALNRIYSLVFSLDEQVVLTFALENPIYTEAQIAEELQKAGFSIGSNAVYEVLKRFNLQTIENRITAHAAGIDIHQIYQTEKFIPYKFKVAQQGK